MSIFEIMVAGLLAIFLMIVVLILVGWHLWYLFKAFRPKVVPKNGMDDHKK